MAAKKDPFNFDDIYKAAGVEDLFVKKTLGEMKRPGPGAGAAPPPQPTVAQPGKEDVAHSALLLPHSALGVKLAL